MRFLDMYYWLWHLQLATCCRHIEWASITNIQSNQWIQTTCDNRAKVMCPQTHGISLLTIFVHIEKREPSVASLEGLATKDGASVQMTIRSVPIWPTMKMILASGVMLAMRCAVYGRHAGTGHASKHIHYRHRAHVESECMVQSCEIAQSLGLKHECVPMKAMVRQKLKFCEHQTRKMS